jgi:hypothetical protein
MQIILAYQKASLFNKIPDHNEAHPCWQGPHYKVEVAVCEWLQIQEPDFYNRRFQLMPRLETSINCV